MDVIRRLEFKDVFGDTEQVLSAEEYLKNINKADAIRLAALCLSGRYDNFEFLCTSGTFFRTENSGFANRLFDIYKENNKKVTLITRDVALCLLQIALSLPECETVFDPDSEINITKSFLALNQQLVKKEETLLVKEIEKIPEEEQLSSYLFYQPLAYSDYETQDSGIELFINISKAIKFFKFIEKNYTTHLKVFLEKHKLPSWKEYLKMFLPVAFNEFINKRKFNWISFDKYQDNTNVAIEFFDNFAINGKNILPDSFDDFKFFREYPLYKAIDKEMPYFIVLNGTFLIERIYKSLYFEFNSINQNLEGEEKVKSFRGQVTDYFSERTILYNSLDNILIGNFVKYSGSDYKVYDEKIKAEPDYYARKYNSILLFESKDYLFNAEVKTSYDYNRIKKYLEDRFLDKKGIPQLINNIIRIFRKELPLDNQYNLDNIEIYPVLVLHEKIFSNVGFNDILDKWFNDLLKESLNNGIILSEQINQIKSLIIIDIDTLVLIEMTKIYEKISLDELIKQYINKVNFANQSQTIDEYMREKYTSFRDFVFDFIKVNIGKESFQRIGTYLAKELDVME